MYKRQGFHHPGFHRQQQRVPRGWCADAALIDYTAPKWLPGGHLQTCLLYTSGIKVVEKRITRDEVYCAEEAFFTGTAAEVTPIRELDNRQIGAGHRGPITTQIQSLFFGCVNGKVPAHEDWLTYV